MKPETIIHLTNLQSLISSWLKNKDIDEGEFLVAVWTQLGLLESSIMDEESFKEEIVKKIGDNLILWGRKRKEKRGIDFQFMIVIRERYNMKISSIISIVLHLTRLLGSLLALWFTLGWKVRKARKAFERELMRSGMSKKDAKRISAYYSKLKDDVISSLKRSAFRTR